MQKLSTLKIQKYGIKGLSITLPSIFASDNNISFGEELSCYRAKIDGIDSLIIPATTFPSSLLSNININESKNLVEIQQEV